MRYLLVVCLLLAACSKDPLREDMQMFCRAADIAHENLHVPLTGPGHLALSTLGPWIEERAKTPELKALVGKLKNGETTLDEFVANAKELAKKANVEPCSTISWATKPQD